MTIQFVMKLLHKYGAVAYTGKGVSLYGTMGRIYILPWGERVHIASPAGYVLIACSVYDDEVGCNLIVFKGIIKAFNYRKLSAHLKMMSR